MGLIDEWATRFFHELDYEREAQNGIIFKEQMAGLDGIVVADVYQDLSNKEVLTTVWVQGRQPCCSITLGSASLGCADKHTFTMEHNMQVMCIYGQFLLNEPT